MKRIWLAALALSGPVRRCSGATGANCQPRWRPTDIKIPPRKLAAPVPALLQTRAHEIFTTTCSGCHGITAQPGPRGPSLFSPTISWTATATLQIVQAITDGVPGTRHAQLQDPVLPR